MTVLRYHIVETMEKEVLSMYPVKPRVTAMDTIVRISISSYKDRTFKGKVYSQYYDREVAFEDLCGMITAMESLYDTLSFPQATYRHRSFKKEKGSHTLSENEGMEFMAQNTQANDKATFIIHVQFRQNATWQGTIQWLDEKKEQHFRSTLEMLKLLDEALADKDTQVSWENAVEHEE